MSKKLEDQLKHLNIPFEKDGEEYLLWNMEKSFTARECYKIINTRNRFRWKNNLKSFSNKKERTKLRENIHNENWEFAETRDNKESSWSWD